MARFTITRLVMAMLLVAGCQSAPPERPLQLPESSVDVRQLQTRRFDDTTEDKLLAASNGVLQDLGFNLDESDTDLGVIVASKRLTATGPDFQRLMSMLDIVTDVEIPFDKEQRIRASLVTWPVAESTEKFYVRITFQRVVWNSKNDVSKRETLHDELIYQEFFDRLSKSVFLEAHSI